MKHFNFRALKKCTIVFIGAYNQIRIFFGSFFNKLKQRTFHLLAIYNESAVENFVSAMFAVNLRETKDFTVGELSSNLFCNSVKI